MKAVLFSLLYLGFQSAVIAQNFVPDAAFGQSGIATFSHAKGNERIRAVQRLSGGQILSVGQTLRATSDFVLMRHTATGQLDATFGTGGIAYADFSQGEESVNGLDIQADGKILVAGSTRLNGQSCAVARFLANGSIDASFGTNGQLKFVQPQGSTLCRVSDIKSLPDNKILICGYSLASGVYKAFVKRLKTNGITDSSFGTNGVANIAFIASGSSYAEKLALDANNNIWVVGQHYSSRFVMGMACLTANGVLNTAFSTDGVMTHSFANGQNYAAGIHSIAGGKILITGYANSTTLNYRGFAGRFNGDGTADASYGISGQNSLSVGTGFNGIYASSLLPDGSLLATGEVLSQNFYRGVVFKMSPTGSQDLTFGSSGAAFFSTTLASAFGNGISATATGIWAGGGEYTVADNGYKSMLIGLNANGQANNGFGNGGLTYINSARPNSLGYRLAPEATGGYYVGGTLENLDQDQFVQRITSAGQADVSFSTTGLSKSDFGSEDRFIDHITEDNGNLIQLAQTGSVSLNFTGLGTFTAAPEYSLVRVSPTGGIMTGSHSKFSFSDTYFTLPIRISKDPSGRPVVLAYQSAPTKQSGYLQRHTVANLGLDNTFGTNGKYQLYGLSFSSETSAIDFFIDSEGSYYVLTHLSFPSTPQTGFRFSKTTDAMAAISSFGNGSILPGTFEVLEPSTNFVSATRAFQRVGGFVITGLRNSVRTIFHLNANGSSHIEIPMPDFKRISQIVPYPDGSYLVGGTNAQDRIQFVRVTAGGQLDAGFNTTGRLILTQLNTPSEYRDALLDAQNRLVVLAGNPSANGSGEDVTLLRFALVTANADLVSESKPSGYLFPNPSAETVFWSEAGSGHFNVAIIDAMGRKIGESQDIDSGAGIDVKHLSKGLYRFVLKSNSKSGQISFLKM